MDFRAVSGFQLVQGILTQSGQHNLQRRLWKTRPPAAAHRILRAHAARRGGSVLLTLCGRPLALLEGNEVLVAHTCLVSVVSCGRGLFYFPVQGPQASLVIRV